MADQALTHERCGAEVRRAVICRMLSQSARVDYSKLPKRVPPASPRTDAKPRYLGEDERSR